jgi:hypothetical protein
VPHVLQSAGRTIIAPTCGDLLYIGGGHSRSIRSPLPPQIKLASNMAGVRGGALLWGAECGVVLEDEPNAFLRPAPS